MAVYFESISHELLRRHESRTLLLQFTTQTQYMLMDSCFPSGNTVISFQSKYNLFNSIQIIRSIQNTK